MSSDLQLVIDEKDWHQSSYGCRAWRSGAGRTSRPHDLCSHWKKRAWPLTEPRHCLHRHRLFPRPGDWRGRCDSRPPAPGDVYDARPQPAACRPCDWAVLTPRRTCSHACEPPAYPLYDWFVTSYYLSNLLASVTSHKYYVIMLLCNSVFYRVKVTSVFRNKIYF